MVKRKVFIVVYYGGSKFEDSSISEVFDSKEKAEEYIEENSKYYKGAYELVIKEIL